MPNRPERPIILFGKPDPVRKSARRGGAPVIYFPEHSRQVARLEPKLNELRKVLLQQSPSGINPEKTLVFVVSEDLKSFYTAVKNFRGDLEWIFDASIMTDATDDFHVLKKDKTTRDEGKESFSSKVYCVQANTQALEEIHSLWKKFEKDRDMKFPWGKAGLKDVFKRLIDIHFWGYEERIEETGILKAWKDDLELEPELSQVKCEIELFYRKSREKQQQCEDEVKTLIQVAGGKVLGQTVIDEINYHAILASLPRQTIQAIIDKTDVALASADQVMFFQAAGQSVVISTDSAADSSVPVNMPANIEDEPIIALFDGLPQENHPYLDGLLNIDDPDNYAAHYTVTARMHGTSMASFIAHGDLNNIRHQITHKIYVRPIMKARGAVSKEEEVIPDDILIVDTIHRAVRRLYEPDAGLVAPSVRVINLSIGFPYRVFDRLMSPLARLLDWLSYTYRVLFIVSAGNYSDSIDVGMSFADFSALNIEERTKAIIRHMDENKRIQRLLSPAESINALTVGASFSDESACATNTRQIIPCSDNLVSPISALGKGLNNSIKPDIILSGGRNTMLQDVMGGTELRWRDSRTKAPGSVSAAPFDLAGGAHKIAYSFGTSNAAALASHESSRCFDTLSEVFAEASQNMPYGSIALLIKAMLVHGAEWGELFALFNSTLGFPNNPKDDLHRFFGYGKPNIDKAVECAKNRISLLGFGELKNGDAHLFEFPLPLEELSRQRILRRITATLASFCPITPSRQYYCSSMLWFTIEGGEAAARLFGNRINVDAKAAIRGGLQHEIFENDKVVVWGMDDAVQLKVNCSNVREDKFAGSVPYALMVSFEIDEAIDIDIYERVAAKVKPPITIL